jgi:Tat protein translocase TatB subunit
MFNVGGGELLVILVLALIVLGPQRLPDALRTVGRVMGEVKRISSGFQQDLTSAIQDMDTDDTPRRRREAVPLAAVVADAGTGTGTGTDDEDDDVDLVALSASPWGDDDGDDATLAPAISDALDEIVTPLPNAAAPDPAGGSSGDGGGDERAAS